MSSFNDHDWFNTGDLVEELNDGYIRIKGRSKDVINVGGERVLPIEVESVVLELKEVRDCLAYGKQNAITGQIVAVQVVLKQNINSGRVKGIIRSHCKEYLDVYKVPVKIEFVNKIDYNNRFKKTRL